MNTTNDFSSWSLKLKWGLNVFALPLVVKTTSMKVKEWFIVFVGDVISCLKLFSSGNDFTFLELFFELFSSPLRA